MRRNRRAHPRRARLARYASPLASHSLRVVRMLLTSAEAIRGSVAMVDHAAGAVCLMAGRLRAAVCAPEEADLCSN